MPTYISLFQKTNNGQKITPEKAQQRRAKGIELCKEHEIELTDLCYGLGEYDFVAVVEAPDTETVAKAQFGYEQEGLTDEIAGLESVERKAPDDELRQAHLSERTVDNLTHCYDIQSTAAKWGPR
jgi:uncharacterized protein with GYD domain